MQGKERQYKECTGNPKSLEATPIPNSCRTGETGLPAETIDNQPPGLQPPTWWHFLRIIELAAINLLGGTWKAALAKLTNCEDSENHCRENDIWLGF